MPETLTAFSVLGLLRDIQQNNGLGENQKRELAASIDELERHYFAESAARPPDLKGGRRVLARPGPAERRRSLPRILRRPVPGPILLRESAP